MAPATYLWAILLPLFFAIKRKNKNVTAPVSLVLGIILTYFAGPCVLLRYALPYILCVPAIWAMALHE